MFALISFAAAAAIMLQRDAFALQADFGRLTFHEPIAALLALGFITTMTRKYALLSRRERGIAAALFILSITSLMYAAFGHLSHGHNFNQNQALIEAARYLMFTVVFITCCVTLRSRHPHARHLMQAWTLFTVSVILIGLLQVGAVLDMPLLKPLFYWENISGTEARIAATFRWQGPFVLFLGASLPIFSAMTLTAPRRRLLYAAVYILGLVVLPFSGARTTLLVGPVTMLPILVAHIQRRRQLQVLVVCCIIFLLVTPFVFFELSPPLLDDYPQIRRTIGSEGSIVRPNENRFQVWRAGIDELSDRPLSGVGPGQFKQMVGTDLSSHSTYVVTLVERGPWGLALVAWVALSLVAPAAHALLRPDRASPMDVAFASGLINILIFSVVGDGLTLRFVWIYIPMALVYLDRGLPPLTWTSNSVVDGRSLTGAKT
jgi:hypothetical protein